MADDIKKELIATQRVADEIRRKDLESQTAYLESTKSLNKKFKKLTDNISGINGDLALSAAKVREGSRDTFEGFLSNKKLSKAMKEAAENPELIKASKELAERQRQQAQEIESNTAIFEARTKAEELRAERDSANTSAEKRLELQAKIDEEQQLIDAETTKVKKAHSDELERLQKNEESIRGRLQENIEESTENKGYKDFTDGVKELTGGVVDIGGLLDDVTKKFNAVSKVAGGINDAFSAMTPSFLKSKKGADNLTDSIEGMVGINDDNAKAAEKLGIGLETNVAELSLMDKNGIAPVMKNMGIFGAALIAMSLGLFLLARRFEGINDFLSNMWFGGPKSGDEGKQLDDIDAKKNDMTSEEINDAVNPIIETEQANIEYQEDREMVENVGTGNQALSVAVKKANDATKLNLYTPTTTVDNRPTASTTGAPDKRYTSLLTEKPKGFARKFADSLLSRNTGLLKALGGPATAGLTVAEVWANLKETDQQKTMLEALYDAGDISEEDYERGKKLLDRKITADKAKPAAEAVGFFAGAKLAAPAAGAMAVAPVPGARVAALGTLILGGMGGMKAFGEATDYALDSDQVNADIAELLGEDMAGVDANINNSQENIAQGLNIIEYGQVNDNLKMFGKAQDLGKMLVESEFGNKDDVLDLEDIIIEAKERNLKTESEIKDFLSGLGMVPNQVNNVSQQTITHLNAQGHQVSYPPLTSVSRWDYFPSKGSGF